MAISAARVVGWNSVSASSVTTTPPTTGSATDRTGVCGASMRRTAAENGSRWPSMRRATGGRVACDLYVVGEGLVSHWRPPAGASRLRA